MQLEQSKILASFNRDERENIWDALLSIDHVIPSYILCLKTYTSCKSVQAVGGCLCRQFGVSYRVCRGEGGTKA